MGVPDSVTGTENMFTFPCVIWGSVFFTSIVILVVVVFLLLLKLYLELLLFLWLLFCSSSVVSCVYLCWSWWKNIFAVSRMARTDSFRT